MKSIQLRALLCHTKWWTRRYGLGGKLSLHVGITSQFFLCAVGICWSLYHVYRAGNGGTRISSAYFWRRMYFVLSLIHTCSS
jgi:hypothetical protein